MQQSVDGILGQRTSSLLHQAVYLTTLAPALVTAVDYNTIAYVSANAGDLRSNPLLLSLMCILYRGAGSLPGDRAGIYARCAELMLRKWDEQRDLYRKLETDHLVEPTLRYLAWWLFTREDSRTTATERELITKTTEFLNGRGYETEEEARAAAREFVEFCRGRMWVFSDAGTTADGEELYGFTHRTFMEYFAAWHLAATSDTPEFLARALAPHIASEGWGVVAELAMKIKSDVSDRGADRIYVALLDGTPAPADRGALLEFLAERLPSVWPAPTTVRALTRAALDYAVGRGKPVYLCLSPLSSLLAHGDRYKQPMAEEVSDRLAVMMASGDASTISDGLRLAITVPGIIDRTSNGPLSGIDECRSFWRNWSSEQCHRYAAELVAGAAEDKDLRILALYTGAIKLADALAMPDALSTLASTGPIVAESDVTSRKTFYPPYFVNLARPFIGAAYYDLDMDEFTIIGQHLLAAQNPPRVQITTDQRQENNFFAMFGADGLRSPDLDETGNLAAVFLVCVILELDSNLWAIIRPNPTSIRRPADPLIQYISSRLEGGGQEFQLGGYQKMLPDLPVPAEFKQLFRDWAEKQVDFVEVLEE